MNNQSYIAYVALGSNMGDRIENFNNAIKSISLLPTTKIVKVSRIYETDPVGYEDQGLFLNAALKLETKLSSAALLGALLGIEAALGRIRKLKDGPRILDLDLLSYSNEKIETEELVLPHPRMHERAFVMAPLCDITSEYKDVLKKLNMDGIRKTDLSVGGGLYEK